MRIKHKLQMVMKQADDTKPLSGLVQIDDVYWGGKKSNCKRGRGATGKTPFVAALVRNEKGYPMFIRFSRVSSFTSSEIIRWAQKQLQPDSIVLFDGLACFKSFNELGHHHYAIKTTGRYSSSDFSIFTWLNAIIGNVKNKIIGTYHGMRHKHLPRYLGEFCFRFNRRFSLPVLLNSLIYYSAKTSQIPQHRLKPAEDWW